MLKSIYFLPSTILNRFSLLFHKASVGKKCAINGRLRLYGKGRLKLCDGVRINSCYRMNPIGGNQFTSIYIKSGAAVEIGKDTGISNVSLYAAEKIVIGERVKLGGDVRIFDTDFHSLDYRERAKRDDEDVAVAEVKIGDDVFIGARSMVLKGVSIGNKSIVGAGSVVTKDIPACELWAGVPAKFIRKLEE